MDTATQSQAARWQRRARGVLITATATLLLGVPLMVILPGAAMMLFGPWLGFPVGFGLFGWLLLRASSWANARWFTDDAESSSPTSLERPVLGHNVKDL